MKCFLYYDEKDKQIRLFFPMEGIYFYIKKFTEDDYSVIRSTSCGILDHVVTGTKEYCENLFRIILEQFDMWHKYNDLLVLLQKEKQTIDNVSDYSIVQIIWNGEQKKVYKFPNRLLNDDGILFDEKPFSSDIEVVSFSPMKKDLE